MGRQTGRSGSQRDHAALRDLLDGMEPDLRLLEGTVAVLQCLAETSDAVEPIALEAIARLAGDTVERVTLNWRDASNALRGGEAAPRHAAKS